MPIAAHTAGGHSTLDVLIELAVLIWTLAGAAAVAGWLLRFARRKRTGSGPGGPRLPSRLRAHAPAGPNAMPSAALPGSGAKIAAQKAVDRGAENSSTASSAEELRDALTRHRSLASASAPASPGARHSPETLEPLAKSLDTSHRLAVAEARVAATLRALPADRWLVERYVVLAGHRIPFLILGETGVFTVWALTGPPLWHELPIPGQVAVHVRDALPGYAGPVRVGICRPLAPAGITPRWWCRPGEPGAWVLGLDWLIRWLEHFGPDHGLGVRDIERLRALAEPQAHPRQRVRDVVPDLG